MMEQFSIKSEVVGGSSRYKSGLAPTRRQRDLSKYKRINFYCNISFYCEISDETMENG
jgi:hypothetical protein